MLRFDPSNFASSRFVEIEIDVLQTGTGEVDAGEIGAGKPERAIQGNGLHTRRRSEIGSRPVGLVEISCVKNRSIDEAD